MVLENQEQALQERHNLPLANRRITNTVSNLTNRFGFAHLCILWSSQEKNRNGAEKYQKQALQGRRTHLLANHRTNTTNSKLTRRFCITHLLCMSHFK